MTENQNIEGQTGVAWNPSLMERTRQFNDFVKNAREKKAIEKSNNTMQTNQDLFTSGMNTKNQYLAKQCNRAIRMSQVSAGIKDFLPNLPEFSDIDFTDDSWTDGNTINVYKAAFPENESKIKNYVFDDSNVNCDPTDFYNEMGWSMSQGEEKTESALKNILKNFEAPFRITGKGVRNGMQAFKNMGYDLADWTGLDSLMGRNAKEEKMWNSRDEALREYALDHYTDYGLYLTEEDWQNAMDDYLKDPSILNKYIDSQNLLNSTVETAGGGTWAMAEVGGFGWIPALINGGISVGAETPIIKEILSVPLGALGLLAEGVGFIMDEVPEDGSIADRVWKSLDDESKQLIEYYSAGKIAAKALTTRDPKTGKISIRPIVKNAAKNIAGYFSDGYNWLRNFKKNRATNKANAKNAQQEELDAISETAMEDLSSKLLNPGGKFERKVKPDLANGLANLPDRVLKNTKTYDGIVNETNDVQGGIVDLQNKILSKVPRKTSRATDVYTTKNGAKIHPVSDAINLLKELYKGQKDALEVLKKYEEKLDAGTITELDKKNLAREISSKADSFNETFELKSGKSAGEAEAIREGLQADIKSSHPFINEFLTVTDKVYSNLAKVKKYANTLADKVSTERDKTKFPTRGRKIMSKTEPVVETIASKGKWLYDQGIKDAREKYKPITMEKDIPIILRAFLENKKNIPGKGFNISAFIELLDEWNYKSSPNEYKYKSTPNNFLEDIIESTDVDNNVKYPSLKETLGKLGLSEEVIGEVEQALNIEQKPLFEDMPSKETPVNKSNKKTGK